MAFRLKRHESIRHAAKRVVREELAKVLDGLKDRDTDDEAELVHGIRKRLKKVRAVLRLIRAGTGDKTYRRENIRFRDISAHFRDQRDAKVLTEACDDLLDSAMTGLPTREVRSLRHSAAAAAITDDRNLFATTIHALRRARYKVRKWKIDYGGWSVLGKGVRRVYEAGRAAFHAAEIDPSVENLHEWRKQAKYGLHQLELLAPFLGRTRRRSIQELKALTKCLGDDHDLALLSQRAECADDIHDTALEGLLAIVRRRRGKLEERAFLRGRRIYRENPKLFLRRLKKSWHGHRK